MINVATNALSGITRLPYGGLYRVQEVMDCAVEAVSEAIAVANANGVKLSIQDPKEAWFKAAEGLPPDFKASILQDVDKRAKTGCEVGKEMQDPDTGEQNLDRRHQRSRIRDDAFWGFGLVL